MRSEPRTGKRVRAIIDMVHHRDPTTAEGIEDAAIQNLLTGMGCTFGEGFHLGRPEPAADFPARFATGTTRS